MTSKERVCKTYRFEKPDLVPIDFCAVDEVYDALVQRLGLKDGLELMEYFQIDFRWARPKWVGPPLVDEQGRNRDIFGSVRYGEGFGYQLSPPWADLEEEKDLDRYQWPKLEYFDYDVFAVECERFEEYAVYGGQWGGGFTQACDLIGTEKFLLMMMENPRLASRVMERITDFFYASSRVMYEKAKGKVDIYFAGDDFGTQRGPTISLELWRKLVKPQMKRLWDLAKSYDLFIVHHCCGGISEFLPDMIGMGLTAIEPVQVRARGMGFEDLVRRFKGKVVLQGSIDTQQTLPFGSPEEVRAEVLSRIALFRDSGGFVLGPSQHLLRDIPLENILTLYETANTHRGLS
jgi:uroporphyrinogen decarboxylase